MAPPSGLWAHAANLPACPRIDRPYRRIHHMPIMDDIFDDGMSYSGPPLTDDMVLAAEAALGVRLPGEYVGLLRQRNGGSLRKRCYPTPFPTSWAPDHIGVRAIFGIGGE